jgi:mono/diheme cytochrome c family protein
MKTKVIMATTASAAVMTVLTLSAQAPKTQWSGIYTVAQAERGAVIYKQKCAACHAGDLSGGTMEGAPALNDEEFAKNWDSSTLSDIYDKVKMLMPQDDPGSLTEQQASDTLAFMLSKSNYPAGTAELPVKSDDLKTIKFVAKKPAE